MGGGKVGERDKRSRRSGGRGLRVRVVVYVFFSRGGCEDVSLNIARADPVPHLSDNLVGVMQAKQNTNPKCVYLEHRRV